MISVIQLLSFPSMYPLAFAVGDRVGFQISHLHIMCCIMCINSSCNACIRKLYRSIYSKKTKQGASVHWM